MKEATLRDAVEQIGEAANASSIGVAVHDFEHRMSWLLNADRWFHAASTIKVPVLLGVFDAVDRGRFEAHSRVHVRNRFYSAADGTAFRVQSGRDANGAVHAAIGKTLRITELLEHMIVTSSNLATNLLVDLVGVREIVGTLQRLGLEGIELCRGVEDEVAWAQGLNNRITAQGLCRALRLIAETRAISADASAAMLEIMHQQRFRKGIPAGLPDDARVAHKTGEMSTVAHDAGIVYLDGREPYVVVILTEWETDVEGRQGAISDISRAVYEYVSGNDA
jgi:beta-lactamase class A